MFFGEAPQQQPARQLMCPRTLRFHSAEHEAGFEAQVSERQLQWDSWAAACAALFQITFFLHGVRSREDPGGQLKMRVRHLMVVGSVRALPALSLAALWVAARVTRRPAREIYRRVRPYYLWFFRCVAICVWGSVTASMAATHRARLASGSGSGGGSGSGPFWFSSGACTQVMLGVTQALVTPLIQMSIVPMLFRRAVVMQSLLVMATCTGVVMPGGFLDQLSQGTAAATITLGGSPGTCGAASPLGSSSSISISSGGGGSSSSISISSGGGGSSSDGIDSSSCGGGSGSASPGSDGGDAAALLLEQLTAAASADEWATRCGPTLAAALRASKAVSAITHALTLLSGPVSSATAGGGDGHQHSANNGTEMCTLRVAAGGFILATALLLPLCLLYRLERSSRVAWLKQQGLLPQTYVDRMARMSAWEVFHSLLLAVVLGANVWAAVQAGVCGGGARGGSG